MVKSSQKKTVYEVFGGVWRVVAPVWVFFLAMRPKQWLKNTFLFAGIFFAGTAYKAEDFRVVLTLFVAFCMASSSGYLFNDVRDVERDRHHPKKRFRPIASGKVGILPATLAALVLLVGAFAVALSVSSVAGGLLILYALITFSYSFFFKHIVLLDIFMLALGFVLRVLAGGIAIMIPLSPWLVICTLLTALFLAVNKRRAELLALSGAQDAAAKGKGVAMKVIGTTRTTLAHYTETMLSEMSTTLTSAMLVTYSLYAFFISSPEGATFSPATAEPRSFMMITIPFVVYAVFRYLYLVHRKQVGESVEEAFFVDVPFASSIVAWALLCYVIIYRPEWLDFLQM